MSSNPFATGAATAGQQNPFAAPQPSPVAPQQTNGAASPISANAPAQEIEQIDLNDPRLQSEQLVNTEGDAYAQPAPLPDARYRVKLKLEGVKHDGSDAARQMWPQNSQGDIVPYLPKNHYNKNGQVDQIYLYTAISATITDPRYPQYEGVTLFDAWVGTGVFGRGSGVVSKVMHILSRLTKPDNTPWVTNGEKIKTLALMDRFTKALAGEPEVGVETNWEWSCQACGEEAEQHGRKRPNSTVGMNKFPLDQKQSRPGHPVYLPEMKCSANPGHGYSKARARIGAVVGLQEVK